MPALARAVGAVIRALRPALVITHPYEGGHPDHDAAALIVHAAAARLRLRGGAAPMVVEMTSYHAGEGVLVTGELLRPQPPSPGSARGADPAGAEGVSIALSPDDLARKRRMLACFATQRRTLAPFSSVVERFRPAPAHDFTRPPHPGLLHYERLGWRLAGARFRELAAAALRELGLDPAPLAAAGGAPPPAAARLHG
jgi:LmbE family N-acetylglucosaminyl deacetylase